jgi:hypothetical protein
VTMRLVRKRWVWLFLGGIGGVAIGLFLSAALADAVPALQDPRVNLGLGFVLGFIASLGASVVLDQMTQPRLTISLVAGSARGQNPGWPAHAFFHALVSNQGEDGSASPGLRPAWSCSASIEVVASADSPAIGPIPARWISHPEPLLVVSTGASPTLIPDVARMISGRRVDVHPHDPQQLSLLVKFEGENDCFLFTNESYASERWSNPAWRLGLGEHRLRVAVAFELGGHAVEFLIENSGPRREDLRIRQRAA